MATNPRASHAGIVEISLTLAPTGFSSDESHDSTVVNTASFKWADGHTGMVHDVALATKLAHLSGWETGTGNDSFTPFAEDGELGRAVAPDGVGDGQVYATLGETTPDQNLVFLRADAGDGVEDLPPIVPNKESLAALAAAAAGNPPPASAGAGAPIVIDMDGNGLSLVDPMASNVRLDLNRDGWTDRLGWVGPRDAILALDRDRDGLVSVMSEISFLKDAPGARTDLEGLRAFDTHASGTLDAGDGRFGDFKLGIDANQDGQSSLNELRSLSGAGLVSLSLTSQGPTAAPPEAPTANVALQTVEATFADGSEHAAGDVVLGSRSGLALALAASKGDPSVSGTAAPGPRFETTPSMAPWALNAAMRRALMGGAKDGAVDQGGGGGPPPEGRSQDSADGGQGMRELSLPSPASADPGGARPDRRGMALDFKAPADAAAAMDAGSTRQRGRQHWWASGLGGPGAAPKAGLAQLMGRMAPASVADREGPSSAGEDRALPMAPELSRQLDLLVQARAGLRSASGGEARSNVGAGFAQAEKVALPSAWKRERLQQGELV